MKKLLITFSTIFLTHLTYAQTADDAVHELQNKRFDKALGILKGDLDKIGNEKLTADQLLLLRARAFGLSKQPEKVIETINNFTDKFPESKWTDKATFLKAQALADLKKHDEASAIYEEKAETIFSPASKNTGAELLMKVAATFSQEITDDETADTEKAKPDLNKADLLLKEAYEMDCSTALKEQILATRIKINTRANNWNNVISLSYLYLDKFDQSWKGQLGSLERIASSPSSLTADKKKELIGENRFDVRFRLAEALHRSNNRLTASRYLGELITGLEKINDPAQRGLLADSVWLRLMASRAEGGQPRNIVRWMDEAQRYLKNHPEHIHASSTVYTIALIYQDAKKHKEAIAAFQDFLDNKYQINIAQNSLTARPETKAEFNQRQKKADARKEEASYRIGLMYLQSKKFDQAKQAWNATSKAYPNGVRWADCQKGLVDIHYQRSLHAVTEISTKNTPEEQATERVKAETALNGFITSHPLDNRVPALLYLIGNIHYIHANEIEKEIKELPSPTAALKETQSLALKNTIDSWEKLITKYPSSSYASDAQYLIATIYENHTGELDKAISAYKKSKHNNAQNRVTALSSQKLIAYSNKTFTTADKPFIYLSTRNIEKVTVRQYWLDIESYFRKGRKLEDISSLDIDLVEADKTWEHKLTDYKKLHLLETKLDIPFDGNKPGICIIKIESKSHSTTTMVMRSDIDIAVRSADQEIIAYAFDAKSNKPAGGVKILVADAGKVVATGTTTEQGIFHLSDKKLADISDLRLLALSPQGAATSYYQSAAEQLLPTISGSSPTANMVPKLYLNQPKQRYTPGELLPISGIIRHHKDGTYIAPNNDQRDYTLTIRSELKLLYKTKIKLQDRGVFSHDYTLPEFLPTERITLALSPDFDKSAADFTRFISVGKPSRSEVAMKLTIDKSWVAKDETISGKIKATYRWGAPYANQKIYLHLPNDDRTLELLSDADGQATFSYQPTFTQSSRILYFSASSSNKRYRSNTEQVLYDPIPFSILASSEHRSMSVGSSSDIEIKTLDPNSQPVSKQLSLEVIKIITVKADPILMSTRSMESVTRRFYKEEILQTIPLTTDPKTGKITHPLKLDKAGTFQLRISGKDVSKTVRTAIARSSITVYDSENSQMLVIQHPAPAQSGQVANIKVWSALKKPVTALLTVETASIIEKRIIQLSPNSNSIPIVLDAQHCPSARVHLMVLDERKLSTDSTVIVVSNPLTIKSTLVNTQSALGIQHKIKVQAFDSNDKPVSADLFINLTNRETPKNYRLTSPFMRDTYLTDFENTSSTGLFHEGTQEALLTDVRDELERLNRAENDDVQRYDSNPILSQQHVSNVEKIRKLLYRGESYYNQAQFDNAMKEYKEILRIDPYSKAARRGMEKVNAAKSDYYRAAYDQTRAQMLMEVDKAWENAVPPELPNQVGNNIGSGESGDAFYAESIHLDYSGFKTQNPFSTNASCIELPNPTQIKPIKSEPATTTLQRIPKEGKEFTINAHQLSKSAIHNLHIIGFNDSNASGFTSLTAKNKVPNNPALSDTKPIEGIPIAVKSSVKLKGEENTIKLTLPEGAIPENLKLVIATSSSGLLEEAANRELVSVYGATPPYHEAHPAGQLMAQCARLDYLLHHKLNKPHQDEVRLAINRLCSELTLSQTREGSWTAVSNRRMSSLLHTAIAYQALSTAKKQGIEIEPSTLVKARAWLNQQQKSIATDLYNSRALLQYALASTGDADFAICNRLYRERKKMSNIGKAFLANAFVLLDRKEFTTTLVKEITGDATISNPQELALNSPAMLKALTQEARISLGELNDIDQDFSMLFHSDIDRGVSVRAYAEYFKTTKPSEGKALVRDIIINGAGRMYNAGEIVEAKQSTIKILKQGENTINIGFGGNSFVTAVISGYIPSKPVKPLNDFLIQDRKYYRNNLLYKGTALKNSGTSEVKSLAIGETVRVILKGEISNKNHAHSILIEQIPKGFTYLTGSLRGNHSGARKEGDHLVITYSSLPKKYQLSYTLIATDPGTHYHRPTLLSPTYNSKQLVHNKSHELTVTNEKTNEPYQINAAEHYELATLHFSDNNYPKAKQHIISYNKLKQTSEDPKLAQMLLWIESANATPDAQLLADSFEVLTERNPDLIIPFEKILKVGKAYRTIGEFERSTDVYTATLEANYSAESYVSAVLEDQSEFALSIDYQDKLWLRYPDLGEITTSRFELGQQIYAIATDKAKSLKLGNNPATKKPYTEKELTTISLNYMQEYLTHTPTHKFAADASFSIANAQFALKQYQKVIDHTTDAAVTYKDSSHATSFRYMQAVGHFWLRNYDKALKAASSVAQENSEDKELAAFITAQIYHAKGQPQDAIKWYESIKAKYPDAAESIAYFEQKSISLDEVKVLNSGDKATLNIKFRNIKEAQFQIYRVDLMKLYLREKNLSNISKINLAGINPKHSLTVKLGDGKDYKEVEKNIELPISKDGAYLVICRGDYLYTSGLMLITPLKMEVQEYPGSESVRVNISDKKSGKYLDSVHVKAVGKTKQNIISGDTDLRGVWQGNKISSPSTIIAKDKEGRYAFFRSKLSPSEIAQGANNAGDMAPEKPKVDFNRNLKMKQQELNKSNSYNYEQKRRSKGKGVEIQKARKK